jgi:hypothetical protein
LLFAWGGLGLALAGVVVGAGDAEAGALELGEGEFAFCSTMHPVSRHATIIASKQNFKRIVAHSLGVLTEQLSTGNINGNQFVFQ